MVNKLFTRSVLAFALLALASGALAVSVSVSPNPTVTPLQQAFTVNIRLDTATPVRGVAVWIAHDTTKLSFNSASRGALFNGLNVGWWRVNTTDTPGTTRVECIIFGSQYTTGPGNLINLIYTANAGDFSVLQITGIELYDYQTGLVMPDVQTFSGNVIIGSQVAYASLKCWLEGPYANGGMSTLLGSLIPLTSPYPSAPASVSHIPTDVVDWMLVELRSSATGAALYSQSVFLQRDGYLRSPGKPFVIFMNVLPGQYYTVLRHRNHLAAMSTAAVRYAGSGSPDLFDYSSLNNIYGRSGVKETEAGIYALAAGDSDQDGGVYPSDRNLVWRVQSGMSGYLNGDFNLDGNVFPSDLNNFWRINSGMSSQVPRFSQ